MRKHLGRSVKNVPKEMTEPKINDLDYTNNNFEYLNKRLDKGIPNLSKQMPRKSQLPGMSLNAVDPTGDSFLDEAKLGLKK